MCVCKGGESVSAVCVHTIDRIGTVHTHTTLVPLHNYVTVGITAA